MAVDPGYLNARYNLALALIDTGQLAHARFELHKVAAVARAVEMGATQFEDFTWGGGWSWTVMKDPEGNEFCMVEPPPPGEGDGH